MKKTFLTALLVGIISISYSMAANAASVSVTKPSLKVNTSQEESTVSKKIKNIKQQQTDIKDKEKQTKKNLKNKEKQTKNDIKDKQNQVKKDVEKTKSDAKDKQEKKQKEAKEKQTQRENAIKSFKDSF